MTPAALPRHPRRLRRTFTRKRFAASRPKIMTKAQRKAHKIGNQLRKARLLRLYHKVKPGAHGWISLGGLCQNGKHTIETGIAMYDGIPQLT